jgi:hypothetical protein
MFKQIVDALFLLFNQRSSPDDKTCSDRTEDSTKILSGLTHARSSRGRHVNFKGRCVQRPRNWTCFVCMRLATTDVCTLLQSRGFTFYDSRIYIYPLCDSGTLSIWRELHVVSLCSGRMCIYLTIAELCVILNSSILSFDDHNVYLYPIFFMILQQVAESRGHLIYGVTSCTVTLVLLWEQEESGITTLYIVLCCREEKEK